jgi:hypothetical protein
MSVCDEDSDPVARCDYRTVRRAHVMLPVDVYKFFGRFLVFAAAFAQTARELLIFTWTRIPKRLMPFELLLLVETFPQRSSDFVRKCGIRGL